MAGRARTVSAQRVRAASCAVVGAGVVVCGMTASDAVMCGTPARPRRVVSPGPRRRGGGRITHPTGRASSARRGPGRRSGWPGPAESGAAPRRPGPGRPAAGYAARGPWGRWSLFLRGLRLRDRRGQRRNGRRRQRVVREVAVDGVVSHGCLPRRRVERRPHGLPPPDGWPPRQPGGWPRPAVRGQRGRRQSWRCRSQTRRSPGPTANAGTIVHASRSFTGYAFASRGPPLARRASLFRDAGRSAGPSGEQLLARSPSRPDRSSRAGRDGLRANGSVSGNGADRDVRALELRGGAGDAADPDAPADGVEVGGDRQGQRHVQADQPGVAVG